MKKVPTAARSAASRKAWRSRKKMKAAREQFLDGLRAQYDKDAAAGLVEPREKMKGTLPSWKRILKDATPEIEQAIRQAIETDTKITIDDVVTWSIYRRLLPCPNFGDKR